MNVPRERYASEVPLVDLDAFFMNFFLIIVAHLDHSLVALLLSAGVVWLTEFCRSSAFSLASLVLLSVVFVAVLSVVRLSLLMSLSLVAGVAVECVSSHPTHQFENYNKTGITNRARTFSLDVP